jgi:hypothetical protein
MPALFDLPVSSESGFDPVAYFLNYLPFNALTQTERDPAWSQVVARLIQDLEGHGSAARHRALSRLWCLHQWELLDPHEQTELAKALWRPANLDPYGLPRDPCFTTDWVLLSLPESVPGQAEAAFRAKYLSKSDAAVSLRYMYGYG